MFNSGGKFLEYEVDKVGEGLLERVPIEEVQPGVQYYLQKPMQPQEFIPSTFHHTVNYLTIEEFSKKGWIWRLIPERKVTVMSLPSETGSENSDGLTL